jgi:hypothetical protein
MTAGARRDATRSTQELQGDSHSTHLRWIAVPGLVALLDRM